MIRHLPSLAFAALLCAALPAAAAVEAPPPFSIADQREHALAGKIYAPEAGRFLSPDALVKTMRAADFVLLGENHDNPDHHALQAWAVRRLVGDGRRTPVAFEMFGTDQTRMIAAHLARRPKDAAGLGKATDWDKTGWPAWTLYSPIAQAALDGGLPIVAANLPDAEAKAMARNHPVDPERVAELGLEEPLPREMHAALVEDIRTSHCNMLPDTAVSPMVMAQRAKDGSMAAMMHRAAKARGMDGAVLIAGAGHVRTDRGVPVALAKLAPDAKLFSLAFIEVVPGETEPADYAAMYGGDGLPFDAVWFTPRIVGKDPCAAFAEHMRKRGDKDKAR